MRNFYTQNGWEGKNYDNNLSLKDIANKIREKIKKEMPGIKFSISTQYYSGGQSLHISLMSAPFKAILGHRTSSWENGVREFKEIPDDNGHAQLSEYSFKNGYDHETGYSNGTKLTREAWDVLDKIVHYVQSFNYNDSDSQIDYFNTNFYIHLNIGKWDKPFQVTEEKISYKLAEERYFENGPVRVEKKRNPILDTILAD